MAKKKSGPPPGPTKTFKYGMPIYGLAWPEGTTFYVCGGGGSVSSGIKNRLVCAEADNGELTDQIAEYQFGLKCPMRLAIAPGGKSILFAIGNGGIQRLDVEQRDKIPRFIEITGSLEERIKSIALDVKAIAFHPSGDYMALGAEDGSIAVYEWPSLKVKLDLSGARKLSEEAIKDLDFVPYTPATEASSQVPSRAAVAKALMVILDNGSAVALDVDKGGAVLSRVQLATKSDLKNDKVLLISSNERLLLHHLPPGMERAEFSRVKCRALQGARASLTCLMNNRNGCHVGLWELGDDGLLSMRAACKAADAAGACMDVSADGSLVAVGTSEGDVVLLGCRPYLRVVKRFPRAHMVFTTNITFNKEATYVLSSSLDASATVNSTALSQPADFKKILVIIMLFITVILMCLLQLVRVLKKRGMTMAEIYALAGLRPREEL
ncbi:hypothetical protein Vafri_898 [Volvox africanus]|nr:hypothetical protein Vafri_898 [Volvox africanus]